MTYLQRRLLNRILTIQRKIEEIDVDYQSKEFQDTDIQIIIAKLASGAEEAVHFLEKSKK